MLNVVVERVQRKREARVPIRRMQFKITSVNPVLHVEVRYTELMSREEATKHGYHMRHKVRNEVTRAICDGRRYTENEPFRILSVDTFAMCSVSMKSNSGNEEIAEV